MPVDVVGALLGWVVSVLGDALVRKSADTRALSRALELAMERVVEQADSSCRDALRVGLRECFSGPPRLGLDACTPVDVGLRRAIEAQVARLDHMVHGDTGQPFYRVVTAGREWLIDQVTVAIVTALRQVVAGGGLVELVHAVNAEEVLARLDTLGARVSELTAIRNRIGSSELTAKRTPLGRPIVELGPFALEVHPAIDAGPSHTGLSLLPPYVERDHDRELEQRIREAAEGRSTMVVPVGGSSTGKTRACWEAIHKLPAEWRLWHPFDPTHPEAVLNALEQVEPQTLVWLNETQKYLFTSPAELGERVAAGLRSLLRDPQRGPVLVLGTMWPEYWDILTQDPAVGATDSHAQARALLTGTVIRIPDAFTDSALISLRAAADRDPRLAQAQAFAQGGQITQFLAGVPALLDRYHNAPVTAKALIEAAMDARRLGHSQALPRSLLEAAVSGGLTDQQWGTLGEDWLEQALTYTGRPCRGVPGPLSCINPRPGQPAAEEPHYRLSDYLEQHGCTTRRARPTTTALWDALIAHATRKDLGELGDEAQRRGLYRYAFRLYQAAAEAGDTGAYWDMGGLLEQVGRIEEAIPYFQRAAETFQRAAEAGNTCAVEDVAYALEKAGRSEEAITWLQTRAEAGDAGALWEAARLLGEAGRSEEAITWLQTRAEAGDAGALRERAFLLKEAGRIEEAITCFQRAAEAGDIVAPWIAGCLLGEAGRIDEAITWLRTSADASDTFASMAFRTAAHLLTEAGRIEEAITCFQRAAEAGDTDAPWAEGQLLAKAGRTNEVVTWLLARVSADDPAALRGAAHLLEKEGLTEAAIRGFQRAAEAGDVGGLREAARLLGEAGRIEEAITWLQTRAEAGDAGALREAARLLGEAGRIEEAITWLQTRAEAGDAGALRERAFLLKEVGRIKEAITDFQRAAEVGSTDALQEVARLLENAGERDEVARLRQYGIEPGGRIADRWACEGSK